MQQRIGPRIRQVNIEKLICVGPSFTSLALIGAKIELFEAFLYVSLWASEPLLVGPLSSPGDP